jgi:arylsulfatase
MELYAGMVDNLDYNIGRLINYLKENDLYKNTIIVFISDNGAAAEDFYNHPYFAPFIQQHYTNHYDSMGQHQSFISYGPQWAEASSSPFRYFKGMTTEGGITAPMIIAGPGVSETNKIKHGFTTLLDIAPTFYEAAGVSYPEQYQEKVVYPLLGRSLNPVLTGTEERIHPTDYVLGLEHRGHVMIRKGEWKLVNHILPFDTANFELYNLSKDLREQQNLKNQMPQKYNELKNEWIKFSLQVGVKNPTPKSGEEL